MKSFARLAFVIPAFLLIPGCAAIDRLPDDTLAKDVELGARSAVKYGLKLAIQKAPDRRDEIVADAKLADDVIKKTVLPAFTGSSTADVLRSAVDTALGELTSKVKPQILGSIQLAINILALNVNLPPNPTAKLDDRTRKAVVGLFTGISEGLEDTIGTPPPPPAARTAPERLEWPK